MVPATSDQQRALVWSDQQRLDVYSRGAAQSTLRLTVTGSQLEHEYVLAFYREIAVVPPHSTCRGHAEARRGIPDSDSWHSRQRVGSLLPGALHTVP